LLSDKYSSILYGVSFWLNGGVIVKDLKHVPHLLSLTAVQVVSAGCINMSCTPLFLYLTISDHFLLLRCCLFLPPIVSDTRFLLF